MRQLNRLSERKFFKRWCCCKMLQNMHLQSNHRFSVTRALHKCRVSTCSAICPVVVFASPAPQIHGLWMNVQVSPYPCHWRAKVLHFDTEDWEILLKHTETSSWQVYGPPTNMQNPVVRVQASDSIISDSSTFIGLEFEWKSHRKNLMYSRVKLVLTIVDCCG